MIVMDGNNSLKRMVPVGNRQLGDTRMFSSDYILPRDYVDKFANEVKGHQVHVAVPDPPNQDQDNDGGADKEGDPTDGNPDTPCASNWKAAAADEKKRMWPSLRRLGSLRRPADMV